MSFGLSSSACFDATFKFDTDTEAAALLCGFWLPDMYRRGEGAAIDAALALLSPSKARAVLDCAGLPGTESLATSATGLVFPVQLPYQLFRFANEASVKEPFSVFNVGFLVSFNEVEVCEEFDGETSIDFGSADGVTGSSAGLEEAGSAVCLVGSG